MPFRMPATKLRRGNRIDLSSVEVLPPIGEPRKIICIGLNYVDHSKESGFEPPKLSTVFARFATLTESDTALT